MSYCTQGCSDGRLTRIGGGGSSWPCSCAKGRTISQEIDESNRRHEEYWNSPLDPAARKKAERAIKLFTQADEIMAQAEKRAEKIRDRGRDLIDDAEVYRAQCHLTDDGQDY